MACAGKFASAVVFVILMIMVGTGAAAAEVTAASPSLTMEAGAASMGFVPSLFVALMASFIPFFLASRFY